MLPIALEQCTYVVYVYVVLLWWMISSKLHETLSAIDSGHVRCSANEMIEFLRHIVFSVEKKTRA